VKSLTKCFECTPIVELNLDKNPVVYLRSQFIRKINFDKKETINSFIMTGLNNS